MFNALYTKLPNAGRSACPARQAQTRRQRALLFRVPLRDHTIALG
jgi:hypothetical protein